MEWIIVGIIIYLAIGVGLLIYAVMTDPWGGLILHFAIPFVLLYPYFILRSLLQK
jgi:hypothetical protein